MSGELFSTSFLAVVACVLVAMMASVEAQAQLLPPVADLPAVSDLTPDPNLPDPLVMFRGGKVTDRAEWEHKRRPELKTLFQHYMYGYMPLPPKQVHAVIEREDPHSLGGKATLREVTLRFGPSGTPPIHLLVIVPNHRTTPAPVFLGINFRGNHCVIPDPNVRLPDVWVPNGTGVVNNRATDAGRGSEIDVWNVEQTIDRGYAFATFYNGDIVPDRPDFTAGVFPHYQRKGQKERGPHDWGAIAAWAWGIQRAVDFLVTAKEIDPKRIAVVGHSRMGKTALLAAAFDERVALVIPLQAGCGGTAPSRGKVGESVKAINGSFPHWFDDTFKEFNDHPELLPFDQNDLVALMAPRPVLFSCATEDTWSNPQGQFEVLQAADPVYRFLGVDGLDAKKMPPVGQLVASRLGYFIRPGKHSMTRQDWQTFLDFADRQFGPPQ